MANCCTGTPCNKITTVGDMDKIYKKVEHSCSRYKSGGTIYYTEGCCDEAKKASAYCLTYDDLTDVEPQSSRINFTKTEGSSHASLYYQWWNECGNLGWYDDTDGFSISNKSWENNGCCGAYTNTPIPISAVSFNYTTFDDFSVSNIDIGVCEDSGESMFRYSMNRNKVYCCNGSGSGCDDNLANIVTTSITLTNSSNVSGLYGNIISKIAVTSDVGIRTYTAFTDFNTASVNNVRVTNDDVFHAEVINKYASEYIENDNGLSAVSYSADAYVFIVPKFRDCEEPDKFYHVHKDGREDVYEWKINNGVKYSKDEQSIIAIQYSGSEEDCGKILENINMTVRLDISNGYCPNAESSNELTKNGIFDGFDGEEYKYYEFTNDYNVVMFTCKIYCSGEYENKIFFDLPDNSANEKRCFIVSFSISCLGKEKKETSRCICQYDDDTSEPRGNCCTGLVNLFKPITCDDDENSVQNKITTL